MSPIQEFRKRLNPRHTFSNPCCLTSTLLDNRDRCLAIISDKDERRRETKDGSMRYQIRKSQPFRPLPPPDLSERWREFSRPITGREGKPV